MYLVFQPLGLGLYKVLFDWNSVTVYSFACTRIEAIQDSEVWEEDEEEEEDDDDDEDDEESFTIRNNQQTTALIYGISL